MERHKILGDQVALYRRTEGGPWHCYTFLNSQEWRKSTKEKSLARAKDVARDWFNALQAKDHLGELNTGKSFDQAAKMFADENRYNYDAGNMPFALYHRDQTLNHYRLQCR